MTVAAIERCRGDVAAEERGLFAHRAQRGGLGRGEWEWRPAARRLVERRARAPPPALGVAVGVDRLERQAAALVEERYVAGERGGDGVERGRRRASPATSATLALGPNAISLVPGAPAQVGERLRAAVGHHPIDHVEQRRLDRDVAAAPGERRHGVAERGLTRRERCGERRREVAARARTT